MPHSHLRRSEAHLSRAAKAAAQPAPWNREEWASAYRNCDEESGGYWLCVEGHLPADLHGTFYRNGPGVFTIGGQELAHPFDGHGLVVSIAFRGGRAFMRSRFVRTEEYCSEAGAGRVLYRGTFGTHLPGGWATNALDVGIRNVANTGCVPWGGKLLATFEAGQPYTLNAATLATRGVDTLGGVLQRGLPFDAGSGLANAMLGRAASWLRALRGRPRQVTMGGDALAAHAHVDPRTGHLLTFSHRVALSRRGPVTRLTVYEFDQEYKLVASATHVLEGYALVHDIAVTENHIVVFQNPARLRLLPLLLGLAAPIHCLQWQAGRAQGEGAAKLEAPPAFVFHSANAYEESGRLVADCVCYPRAPDFEQACGSGRSFCRDVEPHLQPPSELWRYEIDLVAMRMLSRRRLCDHVLEFPAVSPLRQGRRHRYVYAAAAPVPGVNSPQQALVRVDTASGRVVAWHAGPHTYVGEPVLVPKAHGCVSDDGRRAEPVEDAAWVLVMCYDAARGRSACAILDAADIAAGPVASAVLRAPLPHGLHGAWSPECYAPPD
ncbi:hypothetical protein WJX81_002370 [Elliptochloris bilobata]|uniref:Dioxygenase n=1 Tax=Elliptochloris bilobata TaxID=381761 RepID=A0AAW1RLW3_9CHLO